jgi:hypothetical protein
VRAINHALTGAIIGIVVSEPAIAVPAALASHYICDAIPHFDGANGEPAKSNWVRSKTFKYSLYADAVLCGLLVLILAISQPFHWQWAAVCAFVAAAPDFLSINLYKRTLKKKKTKPSLYNRFAGGIQWFERPSGAVVEVAWFSAALIILIPML